MDVSANGSLVAISVASTRSVAIYLNQTPLVTVNPPPGYTQFAKYAPRFSPTARYLAVGSRGAVHVFETAGGARIATVDADVDQDTVAIEWASDTSLWFVSGPRIFNARLVKTTFVLADAFGYAAKKLRYLDGYIYFIGANSRFLSRLSVSLASDWGSAGYNGSLINDFDIDSSNKTIAVARDGDSRVVLGLGRSIRKTASGWSVTAPAAAEVAPCAGGYLRWTAGEEPVFVSL
jgi:hypothetical protein